MALQPIQLDIYRTAIPMRSFEHAAASRSLAEAIVVRVSFSDGRCGWGETLPRPYVTGETMETVVEDLSRLLWPAYRSAALPGDRPADLPLRAGDGRCICAAACALGLADLARVFSRGAPAGEGMERLTGRPAARRRIPSRVSGVLGSSDPAKTARRLRLMWWYGLRDFKLKLGLGADVDDENLRLVTRRLAKAIRRGRASLRVDVNGGWSGDETPGRSEELKAQGVCAVEQPVFCPAGELADLARRCKLPLIADESLRAPADAEMLLPAGESVWWNIRLSKNGGFAPAVALARMAEAGGVPFVLGCMVGESSILSAAQRAMLQWGPAPRFVEGNYGRLLLGDDLTRRSLRFGYAGRLRPLRRGEATVDVDPGKLACYGQLVTSLR